MYCICARETFTYDFYFSFSDANAYVAFSWRLMERALAFRVIATYLAVSDAVVILCVGTGSGAEVDAVEIARARGPSAADVRLSGKRRVDRRRDQQFSTIDNEIR